MAHHTPNFSERTAGPPKSLVPENTRGEKKGLSPMGVHAASKLKGENLPKEHRTRYRTLEKEKRGGDGGGIFV